MQSKERSLASNVSPYLICSIINMLCCCFPLGIAVRCPESLYDLFAERKESSKELILLCPICFIFRVSTCGITMLSVQ
uniref:Uncharacterized protein n=1 Tax=Callorhinchus milii TaxID=7868 RepID=A0A4W3HW19_CALMI